MWYPSGDPPTAPPRKAFPPSGPRGSPLIDIRRRLQPLLERARPLTRRVDPVLQRVTRIDASGWARVIGRVREKIRRDRSALVAAGIAFWTTVAVFPALVTLLTIYGLLSEAEEVRSQVKDILGSVSTEMQTVVVRQLRSLISSEGLGWSLAIGIGGTLWASSSGMANAIKAISLAYGEDDRRSFVPLRAMALLFTVVALLVIGALSAVVAVVPRPQDGLAGAAVSVARWSAMIVLLAAAVAALYRFAPERRHGGWEWSIKAAVAASLAWAATTAVFSLYVRSFANFSSTYGALAGIVVLMFWFYLTALVVMVGAIVAAEMLDEVEGLDRERGGLQEAA